MSEMEVNAPDDPTAEVVREGAGTSNDQAPEKAEDEEEEEEEEAPQKGDEASNLATP